MSFGTGSEFRVYYEGDHDDFVDTHDNVNGTVKRYSCYHVRWNSTRGSNWEDVIEGQVWTWSSSWFLH